MAVDERVPGHEPRGLVATGLVSAAGKRGHEDHRAHHEDGNSDPVEGHLRPEQAAEPPHGRPARGPRRSRSTKSITSGTPSSR